MMDKRDLKLMAKLGIITRDTDQSDAFLLWGKLIDDAAVCVKARALPPPFPNYPAIVADVHDAIAAFTPQEKIALRDRVLGVVELPAR